MVTVVSGRAGGAVGLEECEQETGNPQRATSNMNAMCRNAFVEGARSVLSNTAGTAFIDGPALSPRMTLAMRSRMWPPALSGKTLAVLRRMECALLSWMKLELLSSTAPGLLSRTGLGSQRYAH